MNSRCSSAGGAARKGPKRAHALAPLCKFPGMAGAVAAWEGPPVVLDGTAGYRCRLPHALARLRMCLQTSVSLQPCCDQLNICQVCMASMRWVKKGMRQHARR